MPTRLTMICHAPTRAVRDVAYPADEPVDAPGLAKAAALAPAIRRVDTALTSPALRARQTAAALKLNATPTPVLRDIDLGLWAGRTLAEVTASDPAGLARWTADPHATPHGGESLAATVARVRLWLDGIGADGGSVVAVTHPAVVRAALLVVLDANPLSFWRIDVAPLGRLVLSRRTGAWNFRSLTPGVRGQEPRD